MKKLTRRITPEYETYLRTLKLSEVDRKILEDSLKAQNEYGQLTNSRWNQIKRMAKSPKNNE